MLRGQVLGTLWVLAEPGGVRLDSGKLLHWSWACPPFQGVWEGSEPLIPTLLQREL